MKKNTKKKKNTKMVFTLIIILTIVALIAIPIIMRVIANAKSGAAVDSMYGYIKAIEVSSASNIVTDGTKLNGMYTYKNGALYQRNTKYLDINSSGTNPNSGYVDFNDGAINHACLVFDGINVTYDGTSATVTNSCAVNE